MKQQNYNCGITVPVPAREAQEAIGNIKGWWATNVSGNSHNPGDTFTVRFGKTFATITITEIIPGKKIVWQVIDCDMPLFSNSKEWLETKIIWELSTDGAHTNIAMTHVGLTPALDCFADCEKGWTFFIKESLFRLLTENKGMPGTGIFAYIKIHDRKYEGLIYYKQDPLPDYPNGFCFIDVRKTKGEQVIEAYAAGKYRKEEVNIDLLKGEYFMIIENKPVVDDIEPLQDLLLLINYNRVMVVERTPEEVWEKINCVSAWWTENFEGSAQQAGDSWTVHFGETFVTVNVVECVPYKKIVWKVVDCYLHWLQDKKEWNNTEMIWDLKPAGKSTQITFTHKGLEPAVECFDKCVIGWNHFILESLRQLLIDGKGLPEKKKVIDKM